MVKQSTSSVSSIILIARKYGYSEAVNFNENRLINNAKLQLQGASTDTELGIKSPTSKFRPKDHNTFAYPHKLQRCNTTLLAFHDRCQFIAPPANEYRHPYHNRFLSGGSVHQLLGILQWTSGSIVLHYFINEEHLINDSYLYAKSARPSPSSSDASSARWHPFDGWIHGINSKWPTRLLGWRKKFIVADRRNCPETVKRERWSLAKFLILLYLYSERIGYTIMTVASQIWNLLHDFLTDHLRVPCIPAQYMDYPRSGSQLTLSTYSTVAGGAILFEIGRGWIPETRYLQQQQLQA